MNGFETLQPEQLIGQTRCGHYSIRSYRGKCRDGWVFGARRSQPYVGPEFGGGLAADQDGARVMLEIAHDGSDFDRDAFRRWQELQPHQHLLNCLEVGQSRDKELAGAWFLVVEAWDETLGQFLARSTGLEDLEARGVAIGMGAALARCHAQNQPHGEIGFHNIFWVAGQWKLGPALRRKHAGSGARLGAFAPQRDIAALGLVLLRCLSPRFALLGRQNASSPVKREEIEQALTELPEFWRHWLGRCLAEIPDQRCSAAELALLDAAVPSSMTEVLVEREGTGYRLAWQTPRVGTVRLYRWERGRGRCPARGEIWLVDELNRIAESLPLSAPTEARTETPPDSAARIIVAIVSGNAALVSDDIGLKPAADVGRLKLAVQGQSLVATWDWPEGAHLAEVVVREGVFATGPDDPKAQVERCFRTGYLAKGRFEIQRELTAGRAHVAVYALYRNDQGGWEYASGRTTGARASIRVGARTAGNARRIEYAVKFIEPRNDVVRR